MSDRLTSAVHATLDAASALRVALILEHLEGASANEVARRAHHVISRPTVLKLLRPDSVLYGAVAALYEVGLVGGENDQVAISSPGESYFTILMLVQPYQPSEINRKLTTEARKALEANGLHLGRLPHIPGSHDRYIWRPVPQSVART